MDLTEVKKIEQENLDLIKNPEKLLITTQEEANNTNRLITDINSVIKKFEDKRKSFVDPLNKSRNEINKTFKDLSAPFENAKKVYAQKIMDWRRIELRKKEEEHRKEVESEKSFSQKIAEKTGLKEKIEYYHPIELEEDNTSTRKDWTFELVDIKKVPADLLLLNEVEVRRRIKKEGVREIPGIKIYEDEIFVTGR